MNDALPSAPAAAINPYGDRLVAASHLFGSDIASQRMDDLDLAALAAVRNVQLSRQAAVLDLACGVGGQSLRFADLGAAVVAADVLEKPGLMEFMAEHRVAFRQGDMTRLDTFLQQDERFDVFYCQRALHYLRYEAASSVLRGLCAYAQPGAELFVSFSGLNSELGQGYDVRFMPARHRFGPLAPMMADKHGILQPVCLYRREEARELLMTSGWKPVSAWESAFGNVKIVARKLSY